MRTRKTGREDIPALKALWQEAFGDEQQDIDLFFETVYPNATGFCAEDGGELVSMLFALPQTIVKEEKQLKCAYLYAVATKKDRQGEGLCSALLAYAEKELRKRYVEALLLSPASERLADFYAERGFTRQTGAKKTLLDCAQPTGQATEIGVQAVVCELLPGTEGPGALAEKRGAGKYEVVSSLPGEDGETWCMLKWLGRAYPELEPVYMGFSLE